MQRKTLRGDKDWNKVLQYSAGGIAFGFIYAVVEYLAKLNSDDEQLLVPLLVRASIAAAMIMATVALFENRFKEQLQGWRFIHVVATRSVIYFIIIAIWLLIANSIWYAIEGEDTIGRQLYYYLLGEMFTINMLTISLCVIVIVGMSAINSLHRKGELINFILGRYHTPREAERIFCFLDLKNSTTIAERLGDKRFAHFLKSYFSDMTSAIRTSQAQVYQYVGDEIVLAWSFETGLRQANVIRFIRGVREILHNKRSTYISLYGVAPEFRAALHGGRVIVTWVGEVKKEIVYIGDVVNTTARIREDCKRLEKDILISEELLTLLGQKESLPVTFIEETIPRGKASSVRLYSLQE